MSNDDPNNEIIAYQRSPQPRIDAIEDAAMTRDQIAGVLDTALAFNHTFAKIAKGGDRAEQKAQ